MRLTIVQDEGFAEIVCGALRAEGIPCSHRRTDLAETQWGPQGFGGMRELLVRENDLERAHEILDSSAPVAEHCVRCDREIGEEGGWYSEDTSELRPYCAVCAERQFG